MSSVWSFVTWLTALLCLAIVAHMASRIDGLERELHRPACTWGASSVGPVTIRHGQITGKATPSRTGC